MKRVVADTYYEERLQKKLIPLNLLIVIISLVAAVSLLFTPFLKFNVAEVMNATAEIPGEETDSSGTDSGAEFMNDLMDFDISFTPIDTAKIAFTKDGEKSATFFKELFLDDGLFEEIITSTINNVFAGEAAPEGADLSGIDVEKLNAQLKKFGEVTDESQVREYVIAYCELLGQELGVTIGEETIDAVTENCTDYYNRTVEATEGKFTFEAMACVMLSGDGEKVYTSYAEVFDALLDGTLGGDQFAGMAGMLKEAEPVFGYLGYLFYLIAFCAFMWIVLFLFAFFHMFAKNKRFVMWYAKLFGCTPCFLFWLLPLLAVKILPSVAAGAEVAATVAVLGAVSSMTWISGICYIAMWVLSIFYAFPVKHKIRKLRKDLSR